MEKILENFRRFITENEEDTMLEKLLKLEPEQALALVAALKDGFPNIEKRYLKTKMDALLDKVYKLQHQQGSPHIQNTPEWKSIGRQLQKAHDDLDIVERAYEEIS
tara:strand:- start:458 stop:775 length:318 start_codon:yes stop_codon:yes gene_type:complete